jgi:hypothetical protein
LFTFTFFFILGLAGSSMAIYPSGIRITPDLTRLFGLDSEVAGSVAGGIGAGPSIPLPNA